MNTCPRSMHFGLYSRQAHAELFLVCSIESAQSIGGDVDVSNSLSLRRREWNIGLEVI
jgi:hypothetical protein